MRASLLLLFLSAACGDPLVDGNYRGEPLAVINGSVLVEGLGVESQPNLRVALFWATAGGGIGTEQQVVTTTSFPAQYHLELYHPPPIDSLFQPRWTVDKVAVATPMLYLDHDTDLTFTEGIDELVGGSPDVVLVWSGASAQTVTQVPDDDDFVDLKPGFQRMWANRPVCEGERGVTYFPAEDAPVDLWVGEYWEWFTDWDCDGATNEWLLP